MSEIPWTPATAIIAKGPHTGFDAAVWITEARTAQLLTAGERAAVANSERQDSMKSAWAACLADTPRRFVTDRGAAANP